MSCEGHGIESKRAFDQAAKAGNRIVLPEPDQLLIDIDSDRAEEIFRRQFSKFQEFVDSGAEITYDEESKSGEGHRHIIVKLTSTIDDQKRIFYQALLGSDLHRELLGYARTLENDPHPVLFIELPLKPQLMLPPAPEEPLPITEILDNTAVPF